MIDHLVVQVRAIIREISSSQQGYATEPMLYVEYFKPASSRSLGKQTDGSLEHVPEDNVEMYLVTRAYVQRMKRKVRMNAIIPITDVWRPIQLIPKFPKTGCPNNWTADNSMDLCDTFYLNLFDTKQTYQAVY